MCNNKSDIILVLLKLLLYRTLSSFEVSEVKSEHVRPR